MKKLLIANWKMNLLEDASLALAEKYKRSLKRLKNVEIVIAAPFVYLNQLRELLRKSDITLAAQDVAGQEKGAYTGEVSAAMLKGAGCKYCLIGHSERRRKLGEDDALINQKINQAYNVGLIPILCVGEDLAERDGNRSESVIVNQLQNALRDVNGLLRCESAGLSSRVSGPESELVIAYEPIWAIGTGKYLEASHIQPIERVLKHTVSVIFSEKFYEDKVRLLYGGSVNSIIAPHYWNAGFLGGILVGSASLDAEEFNHIAEEGENI